MINLKLPNYHYRINYTHPPGTYTSITYTRVCKTIGKHVRVLNRTLRDTKLRVNNRLSHMHIKMWCTFILHGVHHLELELLPDCCAHQIPTYLWYKLLFQILQHIWTIIKQNLALTMCINILSVILPHLNVHLTMSFRPTWYVYKLT